MAASVGTLFGAEEKELPVSRRLVILPPKAGGYTNNHTFTIPGGYKWTDFEKVEVSFTWEGYQPGQSTESVVVQKEQIALNPTGWFARAHVSSDEHSTVRATSLNTAELTSYDGSTLTGYVKVLGIIGYLKEDITIGENKTLLTPVMSISEGTDIPVSNPWDDFDNVEIEIEATHLSNVRHTFSRTLTPAIMQIADRILIVGYRPNAAADYFLLWIDLTSKTSWKVSVLVNGGNWSNIKICAINGVKLGPQIVERFVGRPNDNEFINGNMNIWQETNGVQTDIAWAKYHADGWQCLGNGSVTALKETDSNGKNWLKILGSGSGGKGGDSWQVIGQRLLANELLELVDHDGYLTVSFKYKQNGGTNDKVYLAVRKADAVNDFTTRTSLLTDTQPIIADGEEHLASFTVKIDDLADITNGLEFAIGSYNGSDATVINTADLSLTDCKLEWGRHYTKCIRENKALELQRCQRFLEFMYFTAVGNGSNPSYLGAVVSLNYRVTKAKIPTGTITLLNGSLPCGIHVGNIDEETVRIAPLSKMEVNGHITGVIKLDARL